ncbi:heavy metal-binding domain-containing protein [Cellulophaga sp. Hel_I_12]|uniref:heavy metal-binding domain-containing protein n=1 Tax=Cellulophaga sp. Hel_I_12 TaxID=1249972 RepID=UPI0006480D65|nr:heavy metal-binding domain-containing protein [Cellulophaga sp. Hel_I_12]
MNNLKLILVLLAMVASVTVMSCKDGKTETTTETKTETTETQGVEYTSAYVCPMHCEGSGSDMEGKCPSCGMTYVKNEDHKANGHMHD